MPDATFYSAMKLSRAVVIVVLALYLASGLATLNGPLVCTAPLGQVSASAFTAYNRQHRADQCKPQSPFTESIASRAPPAVGTFG